MVGFPANIAYLFPPCSKLNIYFHIIAKDVSSYLMLLLSKKKKGSKLIFPLTQKLVTDHVPKITILSSYLWIILPKGLCNKAKRES